MSDKKVHDFKEVFAASSKYFGGNDLAADIWAKKYALRDGQSYHEMTPEDMHKRLAKEFARIEKKYPHPMSEGELFSLFDKFRYIIPQGSPMFGVGNPYQVVSQSNCFAIAVVDSYGGICRADERIAQISKRRGGVGLDVSPIRPKGLPTHNAAHTTDGIIVFMQRFSNTSKEVAQQGRRGALMLSCSVHHPEILSFIRSKLELNAITGANISVRLTDEFMNAVKADKDYEVRWPVDAEKPLMKSKISAKEVWGEIVKHAFLKAEPGVLFWDNIVNNSPADCYGAEGFTTITTNPSLRASTRVLTKYGMLPISRLASEHPQCEVVNINGVWKPANVFMSGKDKELFKITFTNNQTVFCTAEHKWPILNTFALPIDRRNGSIRKVETRNLSRRDKIYLPSNPNTIGVTNNGFTRMDGFVVGWNQGDGCISTTASGAEQYSFIFSEEDIDSGIGDAVLGYVNSLPKRHPSSLNRDHDSKAFTFSSSDSSVHDCFAKLGLCRKHNGFPETVWTGSKEFIEGYIDGLFSSDGCVESKKRLSCCGITLTNAHKKMAEDVRTLLSFFGIRSLVSYAKATAKFPKYNTPGREYERYDVHIDGPCAAKFGQIFKLSNKNKQMKLEEIVATANTHGNNTKNGRLEYKNDRNYLVVKSVEATGINEDVYDITVDDDTHTFMMECGVTGNCSELPLAEGSSCILVTMNLASYINDPFKATASFDFKLFAEHVEKGMRITDDLVDLEIESVERIIKKVEADPETPEIKANELALWKLVRDKCIKGRRTGLGITALGDAIAMMGMKYGDDASFKFVEQIYTSLRDNAYIASVDMAEERGKFPIFDAAKEVNHHFLSKLPKPLQERVAKVGRRNIACLTTAPAGTTSNLALLSEGKYGTTSGFEPVFMAAYTRKKKMSSGEKADPDSVGTDGEKYKHFEVQHPGLKLFCEVTGKKFEDSPYCGAQASDISHDRRVRLQALATGFVDHAISSTVNLKQDIDIDTVASVYMTAWESGCKGITVYRDGSREGILVASKDAGAVPGCENCDEAADRFRKLVKQGGRPGRIIMSSAPKRPEIMECDIERATVEGKKWVFLIGKLNGQPYEVFGGANDDLEIPKKYTTGWIVKDGKKADRTMYDLVLGALENDASVASGDITRIVIGNIAKVFGAYKHATFSRIASLALRHGIPIKFICDQLSKDPEDTLFSYNKALARVLKRYIEEGEQSGLECPSCHAAKMVYKGGCPSCMVCGMSACS